MKDIEPTPIYRGDKLLGYVEKTDGTWFSYTIADLTDDCEQNEACHRTKKEAVSEIRREYQRIHGTFTGHAVPNEGAYLKGAADALEDAFKIINALEERIAELEAENKADFEFEGVAKTRSFLADKTFDVLIHSENGENHFQVGETYRVTIKKNVV